MFSDTIALTPDPAMFAIPLDFVLFGLTLIGVAVFHHHTVRITLVGLVTISIYKIAFTGFKTGPGMIGFLSHVEHKWVILANLLCLLMGFALLSRHFEKSHVPVALPKYLPHDWKGGFILLVMVWVLSSFLDNIAAALIGGAMAHQLFRAKVHLGYLAAIVAASNAGGAWSVLGDTTTTMMWIAGVSPVQVFHAIIAATVHRAGGSFSLSRRGRVGGDTALGRSAPAGLGSTASSLPRLDLSALAGVNCFDDAGGKVAAGILENDAGPGFSIRRV
jgi:Na+/H+ antiporter NhaD/arsenite permease-like protein